jgi:hypothetical protein
MAINLETQTETKTVAGETPQADTKGKIVEYTWWLKKNRRAGSTILSRTKLLRTLVKQGASLYDPESTKETIAKQKWVDGRKSNAVDAYSAFLKMKGGNWEPPKYKKNAQNAVYSNRD